MAYLRLLPASLLVVFLYGTGHAGSAAPNPLSLLKDKRVLLINGDNAPEYHKGPRDILTALDRYDVVFLNYFTRAEYPYLLIRIPFPWSHRCECTSPT